VPLPLRVAAYLCSGACFGVGGNARPDQLPHVLRALVRHQRRRHLPPGLGQNAGHDLQQHHTKTARRHRHGVVSANNQHVAQQDACCLHTRTSWQPATELVSADCLRVWCERLHRGSTYKCLQEPLGFPQRSARCPGCPPRTRVQRRWRSHPLQQAPHATMDLTTNVHASQHSLRTRPCRAGCPANPGAGKEKRHCQQRLADHAARQRMQCRKASQWSLPSGLAIMVSASRERPTSPIFACSPLVSSMHDECRPPCCTCRVPSRCLIATSATGKHAAHNQHRLLRNLRCGIPDTGDSQRPRHCNAAQTMLVTCIATASGAGEQVPGPLRHGSAGSTGHGRHPARCGGRGCTTAAPLCRRSRLPCTGRRLRIRRPGFSSAPLYSGHHMPAVARRALRS
jgi:hypothetical protein